MQHHWYFIILLSGLGILAALTLFKALFLSRGAFLRVQAVNAFTSLMIMLIMTYVCFLDESSYIDLALIYVIINYVGIVSIMKYVVFVFNTAEKGKK